MTVGVEAQIAEWRAFVVKAAAVDARDVDELEAHLRDQIAELDALSLEFAREHRARLWKQLVLRAEDEPASSATGWVEALLFAVAAAIAVQIARLVAGFPDDEPRWLLRNATLFVVPFLAGYFAHRRQLDTRRWVCTIAPFVLGAIVVNVYPWDPHSSTETLVAVLLPVVLWFAVAYPYMGGTIASHERRMDFVRFTGEWAIYYALIALGGGVLMALTGMILKPIDADLPEHVAAWVLPSGAAGAVVVAAWLVESKQQVVENLAPVLTMLFTPLFAVMLTVASVTYAVYGITGGDFDRELLGVFDALMVVVLGLVLYAMSARDPSRRADLADGVGLVTVVSALVLDVIVLGAMVARIGDLGFSPNRTVALLSLIHISEPTRPY